MSANRLAEALSPYLRQHAANPVHWQPWDERALAQAQQQDRPILLSVGYAACHWCHVMAHESFEDEKTAALMNAWFVNIKVDREERPDLDRIYQAAHYIFARHAGGWPLTMFLTPAGEPFFGGTYFPKERGRGMPSFAEVLDKVATAWRDKREDIIRQNAEVIPLLRELDSPPPPAATDEHQLAAARDMFADMFDPDHGGLGGAPKFPHPAELTFCLAEGMSSGDERLLSGVRLSLEKMAAGGLCDHLGGGFFRYCVDERWAIPHFEKMLYDNGLLMALFADGARAFASPTLAAAAAGAADWTVREMRHDDGGFYSSLDADSAGGEGAFYVWDAAEIESHLAAAEYAAFAAHFALAAGANFDGHWHLARRQNIAQTAAAVGEPPLRCAAQIETAARKLFVVRAKRERPATDDKILAAWNGLMIRGLARAGRLFLRPEWTAAAADALNFIDREMTVDGRLSAVWRDGNRGGMGFLDDCAFLLDAALELLRADFSAATLNFARCRAEELQAYFEDSANGGFFFTAADGESLIRRPKPADDNATPSGNGIATQALPLLSWLTGEPQWAALGERALHALGGAVAQQPAGCASLLTALRAHLSPPSLVFLVGEEVACAQWRTVLEQEYHPDLLVFILPADDKNLPVCLQKPRPSSGARAFVCERHACRPPVDNLEELVGMLGLPFPPKQGHKIK